MWARSIGFSALCAIGMSSTASAQLPPQQYQEIFQDPSRGDRLTAADLPNLGRLVVLEATSMFVHARSELASSPNSFRLLEQIRFLWGAADAFTSTVVDVPTTGAGLEVGRLSFTELEQAYNQVRDAYSVLPGGASLSHQNMLNAGRVIAVIRPLLREAVVAPANRSRVVPLSQTVRVQARELMGALGELKRRVAAIPGDAPNRKPLDEDLARLTTLLEGLDRIAEGSNSRQDLAASVRPLRSLLQHIDIDLQRAGLNDLARGNELRALQRRTDALADRLQIPREIIPSRPLTAEASESLMATIDKAAGEANRLLEAIPEGETALDRRLLAADARRIRSRLYLLRQSLVGQEGKSHVSASVQGLERSRTQLGEAAGRAPADVAKSIQPLLKSTDETISKTREILSKPL